MITIDPETLAPRDAYRLLISCVVPRPIGWASTIGLDGSFNLAPYSFFNGVGGNPPMVMISCGQRQGAPKDTLRNIQETGEFVINIVDRPLAEAMNLTSGEYGYGVNEFEIAGLEMAPSLKVKPERVALAPVALECLMTQIVPVEGTRYTLAIGRVVAFHLREGLLRENGLVDAKLLNPVARLGGDEYAVFGEVFSLGRPG